METSLNQSCQGSQGVSSVDATSLQSDHSAFARTQHHKTHNGLSRYSLFVCSYLDDGCELLC